MKAPKPEPEKPLMPKRPADARDAREVARKLIKSGAIPAIQKQQTKQDQTSFKRPKGIVAIISLLNGSDISLIFRTRKKTSTSRANCPCLPTVFFNPKWCRPGNNRRLLRQGNEVHSNWMFSIQSLKWNFSFSRIRGLYQQFAAVRDREERGLTDKKGDPAKGDKPRAGNTIFVSGNKVTEEFLKKNFADFGTIVNVSMEIEKGFVFPITAMRH